MPRPRAILSIAQLTAEIAKRQREAKTLARTKAKLQKRLKAVETRLAILLGEAEPAAREGGKPGRPRKRRMSAAGRARIVAAQKARWAKIKAAKVTKPAKKRKMSAAGLARIKAAAKARWEKYRAEKAKANKPAAKAATKPAKPVA